MSIQKRIPKSASDLKKMENKFVEGTEKTSLSALTLDELATRYDDIEQQSQLIQGQILLEAKSRFSNTNEFGAWIQAQGGALCAVGKQHRTRLMNLAKFFTGVRTLDRISITAAYEISAPQNEAVAVEVYNFAVHKNMPVSEIKKLIAKAKSETMELPVIESVTPVTPNVTPISVTPVTPKNYITGALIPNATPYISGSPIDGLPVVEDDEIEDRDDNHVTLVTPKADLETQIMELVKGVSPQIAIVALKNCMDKLNALRYPTK